MALVREWPGALPEKVMSLKIGISERGLICPFWLLLPSASNAARCMSLNAVRR